MQKIAEQLATLALQPCWDNTAPQIAADMQHALTEAEQAQLKEKIICFVYTPDPEEPETPEQPELPEEPEEPETNTVKLAG